MVSSMIEPSALPRLKGLLMRLSHGSFGAVWWDSRNQLAKPRWLQRPQSKKEISTVCVLLTFNKLMRRFWESPLGGKPRKNSAKESERMKSASMCLNLLSTLKLPYAVFTRYARMFGVPLVSYGWFAKLPTLGETKKLWSTIKRGQRTGLMANAWIRAIIYGGVHHLDCVTATQLLRVVSALFAQGWVTWNSTTGCPVHSLRNWAGKNKLSR